MDVKERAIKMLFDLHSKLDVGWPCEDCVNEGSSICPEIDDSCVYCPKFEVGDSEVLIEDMINKAGARLKFTVLLMAIYDNEYNKLEEVLDLFTNDFFEKIG